MDIYSCLVYDPYSMDTKHKATGGPPEHPEDRNRIEGYRRQDERPVERTQEERPPKNKGERPIKEACKE